MGLRINRNKTKFLLIVMSHEFTSMTVGFLAVQKKTFRKINVDVERTETYVTFLDRRS